MSTNRYVGARYVPLIVGNWDNTQEYEPLSVVLYQGNSYTSRQAVPAGIAITNLQYWAPTGNYNAQVEQYRQEVSTYSQAIEDLQTAAETAAGDIDNLELAVGGLSDNLDTETDNREDGDQALQTQLDALDNRVDDLELEGQYIGVIGDSFSTHNSYDYWPQILARKTGLTVINKAVNGTGFTQGSNTTNFAGQLASLASDEHFEQLKCILVYGGVNDYNLGSSAATTATAINNFISAYEALENRPPLILAFGNAGKANIDNYNSFMSWYQLVRDSLVTQDAVIVDDVPFWLLPYNSFNSDLLHPDSYGQHMIYKYMYKLVTGSYAGQHHFQQDIVGNFKYTLNMDHGVVTLHIRCITPTTLTDLVSNTFNDLGQIINYPLMFGGDSSYINMGAWCYSWPLVYAIDGASNQIGIIRPLFNASNGHLYMQMFGSASVISGQSFTIGSDQEMQFCINPTRGQLL